MLKGSKEEDGNLDFSEFVHYMIDHEKRLELIFKRIDMDNDSKHISLTLFFVQSI